MIDSNQYKAYLDKWHEIKENIEGQLENMGFDLATKKQAHNALQDTVVSIFMIGGHVFTKFLPSVLSRVAKSF